MGLPFVCCFGVCCDCFALCCVWCLVLGDVLFLYVIGLLCLVVVWDLFWLFWFVGYSRVGCVVLLVLFVYVMGLYC